MFALCVCSDLELMMTAESILDNLRVRMNQALMKPAGYKQAIDEVEATLKEVLANVLGEVTAQGGDLPCDLPRKPYLKVTHVISSSIPSLFACLSPLPPLARSSVPAGPGLLREVLDSTLPTALTMRTCFYLCRLNGQGVRHLVEVWLQRVMMRRLNVRQYRTRAQIEIR